MAIFSIGLFAVPGAFADDAIVTNAPGSSTPGCEETDSCFIPNPVTIDIGNTVTWDNTDTAAHTVTAGSAADGPSGVWDSSLIMAGGSFSHTFYTAGTYPYYCAVHPWMQGTVIVESLVTTAPGSLNMGLLDIRKNTASGYIGSVIDQNPIDIPVDETVAIAATIQNLEQKVVYNGVYQNTAQDFAFVLMIRNTNDETIYNESITGSLQAEETAGPVLLHTPTESGLYTVTAYLYESIDNQIPLADPISITFWVTGGNPVTVTNALGSSTPGCEPDCFIPSTVTIPAGGTVTWENTDNAAHTATSGSATDGSDGVWDSSLIMAGGSFSFTFYNEGTYPYFCMVHPWMQGTVIVDDDAEVVSAVEAAAEAAAAQAAAEAAAQAAAEAAAQAAAEAAAQAAAEAATWAEDNPGMVLNQVGSSTPGCEPNCFIPNPLTIEAGDTITWVNGDTAAHTATAGSPTDGPSGVFDSSLIMAGGSYSVTLYSTGTYDYFCMVHPWMEGTVIVEGTSEPEPETTEAVETEAEVVTESDEITSGSEIQIQTDIVNQQDGSQIFAYIVQIKYEDGTPISISTITGSLAQGQTLTQSISWTPDEPGTYVAEIFIWDDLDSANPLSSVEVQYFTVA